MGWQKVCGLAIALMAGTATNAIAAPLAEITLGDDAIKNQTIESGATRVVVTDFQPISYEAEQQAALRYEIYIDGQLQAQLQADADFMVGDISLINLDPDGVPEVVFHRYTGGAHCCSVYTVYSWQDDRLHRTLTFPLDAATAGIFEDLDGDGYSEFLSADDRFLYAFGSYASSWPPLVILSFRQGTLIDVTRQFPEEMRANAANMAEHTSLSTPSEPALGANSILAGYVAQKIMLDEYESGWDYMLDHYDPADEWGLTNYDRSGEVSEIFADYPDALDAFLRDLGYLDINGNPNQNLDLSRAIVEQRSLL